MINSGYLFNIKPRDLIDYLKGYVIGQDEAIEILSIKIANHYNRIRFERNNSLPPLEGHVKSNILMIGPSGSGKSYIVNLLAKKLKIPFILADATKFSETSFRGDDVESMVRNLYDVSGKKKSLTELGIIFIDEFDKLAVQSQKDYSTGWGVQKSLLKIIEQTKVSYLDAYVKMNKKLVNINSEDNVDINTKNILFIFAGAFPDLDKIMDNRTNQKNNSIGFSNIPSIDIKNDSNIDNKVLPDDIIKFGFERELIGRIPVLIQLNNLNEDNLYSLLSNGKSACVEIKKRIFNSYGIELDFTEGALREISRQAVKQNLGVRGLTKIIEEVLYPFERDLPDTNIKSLKITKRMVVDPEKYSKKVIKDIFKYKLNEKISITK